MAKFSAKRKNLREGGLFLLVSGLVTILKYLMLQFLPSLFSFLPLVNFGWPGVRITLLGESFLWNIVGYDADHGGLPYFCAYMCAMILGEIINFIMQRRLVFKSRGRLAHQILCYTLAFALVTCVVNSVNCIWVAVAGSLVPDFIYNIGTIAFSGVISMIVLFAVNRRIF